MGNRICLYYKYLIFIFLLLTLLFSGCTSIKKGIDRQLQNPILQNSLHGLMVMDAKTQKIVYKNNSSLYFTPASNVKIATFYSGLKLLPKNIPSLKYLVANDTLFVESTGDPTWLHPYFQDSTSIKWLKKHNNICLYLKNSEETRYGPGWAWEDYDTYFSPEKGTLPLYGNVVTISTGDSLSVIPRFFQDSISFIDDAPKRREEFNNRFYINPSEKDTVEVPFITSPQLTKQLLESVLGKKISTAHYLPEGEKKVLHGIETDSIYKQMLFESDNFLAEQLMITASSTISDTLSVHRAIAYMLENDLSNLEQQPRWVDGSGLSRYNLFTPQSFVQILRKIYTETPHERLFYLFPIWDASGTVEKWQDSTTEPFIFAKSGSLGNNYNLSGYVKTKSGKLLIFSFMNNHFKIPTSQIRSEIYIVLKKLYEDY
ncbi:MULTISPECIES: D-alanyl-D-alanine carboxypeptidase [Flavobacteriaceae]|uniref:D-alanyl-D-alanine carboxypeptidase n=1 Tax=Flavobacteriaceae TaxID=49546 RepID=UPI0014910B33|nr:MULTISPECIES: D-alanyl-D-alanine carboxypeptidase [Allomuricauda]MDC6365129.1 D-alanyl-D-alanine carboxypeptidase [Muricauda sp. AC10]